MPRFPPSIIDQINAEINKDVALAFGEDEQAHNERHWPERIERQAQAFKRILNRHRPIRGTFGGKDTGLVMCATCKDDDDNLAAWPCDDVTDLANIYNIEVTG